ncbi:TonB-dependent receptor [Cupriavidus sp. 8B]
MYLESPQKKKLAVLISGLMMNSVFTMAMAADATSSQPASDKDVTSLTDVSVKSQRSPEAVSRAKQQVAPNLINTVTQEEIRKLPDINAGEAAGRLPGASLSVDTGQGRWVNIRGLDSDLTSTTYGGIRLPPTNPVSPQNGGRAFAFDTFPTGMIGSLTITKTNKPEQDAEALGGTIEITPKAIPLGRDHFVEFRAGTGRQNSRGTGVTDLAVTGGIRFGGRDQAPAGAEGGTGLTGYGDKPFSFVGSLSYYKDALGTDDRRASFTDKAPAPNLAWSNMTQAFYQFHRTTQGAGGEIAYQPNADNRWYARYLYSGYTEDVVRDRLVFKTTGASTQNADGSITSGIKQFDKTLRYMREQVSLNVFQLGGENKVGTGKLDYNVAHTEGKDFRPYDTIPTYTSKPKNASITYNQADSSFPSYTVIGANPLDPNAYTLASYTNNTQTFLTKEWSAGTNYAMPTHFTGADDEEMKFGAAVRLRTNSHTFDPYTSTSVPGVNMAQAIYGSPITYYDGHYANGYNISQEFSRGLFANGTGAGFATDPAANRFAGGAVQQDNKEDVYAVYGQERLTFGKLGILAGVRIEATHAQYNGNASVPTSGQGFTGERGGQTITSNGSTLVPVSASNSYANVFPSLQARYEILPALIGRASFSSTIARPGFNQTNPAATIDAANNVVTQGNANLKPITSNNPDVSLEHYLSQGGIVSVGVFDKELSNYIVGATRFGGITNPVVAAALGPQSSATQVVTYANIAKARALGFELNYDQKYTSLPGWLSGVGTSFNYTFVDARGEIRPGESKQLPSTSRNTFNAAVYWEHGRVALRAAASYVGRNLLFVGANSSLDQYTESRLSADVSATYAIDKNFSIYFLGRNLLDTPHTITEGSSNRVIQRETFGKALMVGVTGKF